MTEEAVTAGSTAQKSTQIEELDASWLTLQRVVAVGMIVVLLTPMVVVLRQFIPPLAIVSVLFAVALGFTWLRPKVGAIGVGMLAGVGLLGQLANLSMVVPELTRPSAMLFFLITLGMLVFGVAGLVGLAGVLRRWSGQIAVRTLQAVVTVMVGGAALSLVANLS